MSSQPSTFNCHVNNPNRREIAARNRINLWWKKIARWRRELVMSNLALFSQRVLNFHTCLMSFPESKAKYAKAKRIDKHSIGNRGIVERFRILSRFCFIHFFLPRVCSISDGLIRKLGHSKVAWLFVVFGNLQNLCLLKTWFFACNFWAVNKTLHHWYWFTFFLRKLETHCSFENFKVRVNKF